ncbi:ankyrin [Zopfia rhizophila CBS 207.26]|uniref:Ankyrin n=1 Tax=Zopfia rhizophila CBS 207.26 TaxID=1314779 RepID=A0A6A6E5W8_9PEZI|nr:ankyrin [Zopfia rhizophila CBS 207.26]
MTKDWDSVQIRIKKLSVDQKKCLEEVKAIMESKYRFRASTRAYRMKLKEWGYTRHNPRKATAPNPGSDGEGRDGEESDRSATAGGDTPLLDQSRELLPRTCPWTQGAKWINDSVMKMLAAVLDADSQKLEQLIQANPNHVNHTIGLPFDGPGGRFLGHPAAHSCILLQHQGQTLLDVASALPSSPVIWVLLAHGAKGTTHPRGTTDLAFHNAIRNGRTFTVQSLIDSGGAKVNGLPGSSWKPLRQAAFWIMPDIVRLLLDRGAEVNDNPLHLDGMPFKTALQLVLDRRVTDNTNPPVREGCEKILKMLLDAGANIHTAPTEDLNGLTPFETFIRPWQGDPLWISKLSPTDIECFESFVRKGADLQIPFNTFPCAAPHGQTFEHQVLWHSTPLAARLLIDHAAPSPEANGSNMLHEIVGSCPDAKRHPADTLRDVEVLLKRGADPNYRDSHRSITPLARCLENCPAVDILPRVRILIDGGADPELRDGNGVEPIIAAVRLFEEPLNLQLMELMVKKYRGRYPNGIYLWSEGYFPISGDPTFAEVLKYSERKGRFAEEVARMLPDDVRQVFQEACVSIASRNFLDAATKRAKMTRGLSLTASEKGEIQEVIAIRQAASLSEYRFDQGFVMGLLRPTTPLRIPTTDFAEASSSAPMLYDGIAMMPGLLPESSLSASLPSSLPTPLPTSLPSPLPVETSAVHNTARRASASSDSSHGSTSSFFVPSTTMIKWPVGKPLKPGNKEKFLKLCEDMKRYKCDSCGDRMMYSGAEYTKHEEEHLHSVNCFLPNCPRRFCVAER